MHAAGDRAGMFGRNKLKQENGLMKRYTTLLRITEKNPRTGANTSSGVCVA